MNRRASFAIIGAVMFFCLLLLFALLLWARTKDDQATIATHTQENSLEYQMNLLLIGILRSPLPVDVNDDKIVDKTTVADAISVGKGEITSVIQSNMPESIVFELRIVYVNGTEITIRHTDFTNRWPGSLEEFRSTLPSAEMLLPSADGNIRVVLQGADEESLRDLYENGFRDRFEGAVG